MVLSSENLKAGDSLVRDNSDKPQLIEDVQVGEDNSVTIRFQGGVVEVYRKGMIFIVNRPVL